MKIFADLHLHSHYSRATSNRMDIENLERNAKIKGLNLLGTGDFTHPLWLKELKSKLNENEGLLQHKDKDMYFMLQAEVSNIYNDGRTRKVHNVLLAPSFDIVEQINEFLDNYGKLASDGRPILTKITCEEMAEVLGVTPESVSRVLAQFKRDRILSHLSFEVYERDKIRLQAVAGF